MIQQDFLRLNIRYDPNREAPYFCDNPETMECEAIGFSDFYNALMTRLADRANLTRRYQLPVQKQTGFENVEFRSLKTMVEQHNSKVNS